MARTLSMPALALALLALSAGCGHRPAARAETKPGAINPRPGWIPSPNRSHPEQIFVTGSCSEIPHKELARRCALADAKSQIRRLLKREALPFRGSYIKDEHREYRRHEGKLRYSYWVLVAYPRKKVGAPVTSASLSAEEQRLLRRFRAMDAHTRRALLTLLEGARSEEPASPATPPSH